MIKVHRNSRGFTLIELLIVIAIIGILAAIAIPAYTGYTKKSKVAGIVHTMGGIKSAVAAYYTEKGSVTDITMANIPSNLGVTVPTQYISDLTVNNSSNNVTITATATNIAASDVDGKTLVLYSTDPNLLTWSWTGNIDIGYRPKN